MRHLFDRPAEGSRRPWMRTRARSARYARLFRVSVSFVSRLLQRRRQGKDTLAPEPHGGGPTHADPDDLRRLEDLIREHNDDTLDQLIAATASTAA